MRAYLQLIWTPWSVQLHLATKLLDLKSRIRILDPLWGQTANKKAVFSYLRWRCIAVLIAGDRLWKRHLVITVHLYWVSGRGKAERGHCHSGGELWNDTGRLSLWKQGDRWPSAVPSTPVQPNKIHLASANQIPKPFGVACIHWSSPNSCIFCFLSITRAY